MVDAQLGKKKKKPYEEHAEIEYVASEHGAEEGIKLKHLFELLLGYQDNTPEREEAMDTFLEHFYAASKKQTHLCSCYARADGTVVSASVSHPSGRSCCNRCVKDGQVSIEWLHGSGFVDVRRIGEDGKPLVPKVVDILRFEKGKLVAVVAESQQGYSAIKAFAERELGKAFAEKLGVGVGEDKTGAEKEAFLQAVQENKSASYQRRAAKTAEQYPELASSLRIKDVMQESLKQLLSGQSEQESAVQRLLRSNKENGGLRK